MFLRVFVSLVMVFHTRFSVAAHHQTRVMWEKVIVNRTLIVLENLYVEHEIVKAIFHHLTLTGITLLTAVEKHVALMDRMEMELNKEHARMDMFASPMEGVRRVMKVMEVIAG